MPTTKNKADDQPRKLDESPREGGVYVVNGVAVDATGKAIADWTVDADGTAVPVASSKDAAK